MEAAKEVSQVPRTRAEQWFSRFESAANRNQLGTAWRELQDSSAQVDIHMAILCEPGKESDYDDIARISFPDGTLLVGEPRFSKGSPWSNTKLLLQAPSWLSLVDHVGVFDRGMFSNSPEAIHGLLNPNTVVRTDCWAELVLRWVDRFGVDRFPRGYDLTKNQLADLLHKATEREVRALFQTLLGNGTPSDN